jgi:glycosyltransferase involved in cell wall biosynthesis
VRHYRAIAAGVASAIDACDAAILRVPSPIGAMAAARLDAAGRHYGVEVVGDPYDVFAPGAVPHLCRPLLQWWMPRELKRICAGAVGAAYVTREALQRRYPCAPYAVGVSDVELSSRGISDAEPFTTFYSSIELGATAFKSPDEPVTANGPLRIITVGTLEQLYKAQDVLIGAVARCVGRGADVHLTLVGDGKYRAHLERLADELGVADRVVFKGHLSPIEKVRAELDRASLFVLPSRTEGLPRALIEAMARGLPAIGSTVGGIPELLPAEDMVPPGDVEALTSRILEFYQSNERRRAAGARNLIESRTYHEDTLTGRRDAFYRYVCGASHSLQSCVN